MRRFIRFVAISLGVLLALCAAGVIVRTLVTDYQYERSIKSISKKLATVAVSSPQIVWATDLHPYGFPEGDFDSPYLDYTAPSTVAISGSVAAVTFQKSSYAGNQQVQDIHLVTLSIKDGAVLKNTQWPRQGPLGLSPGIFCCTKNNEFYAYDDGWLLIKNGEVIGKQKTNPVGPNTQQIKVTLGNSNRPTTIEIAHEDGSKSTLQTDCGLVHTSFLSKDRFVMIGCNVSTVIGTDGHILFSDSFADEGLKGLHFGGRTSDGSKFVISVTSYRPGDPPSLTDEWLVIYDTEKQHAAFALKSGPLPYQQSQTALSADGKYLLVGSGGHVELVDIRE
jgi:hypothetical protein